MQHEIEELKKDIGSLFLWHSLWKKLMELQQMKNFAVKSGDFEAALVYRKKEQEIDATFSEINEQLEMLSAKYTPTCNTKR